MGVNDKITLAQSVQLYGGFAGTETALSQRNLKANETKLNGQNTARSDALVIGGNGATSNDTRIDGFTTTGGNNSTSGGGMANSNNANPLVINCTFVGNSVNDSVSMGAGIGGGGMWNYKSNPTIINSVFAGNSSSGEYGGGGMYNDTNSSPTLINCTFTGNSANNSGGGGMTNYGDNNDWFDPIIINCTFSGNSAITGGGAIYNLLYFSRPTIVNTIFWGNLIGWPGNQTIEDIYSQSSVITLTNCVVTPNGVTIHISVDIISTDIITADPQITSLDKNGIAATIPANVYIYSISNTSSAIDKGLSAGHVVSADVKVPNTDQRGVTRPQLNGVDIGAYEYDGSSAPTPTPTPTPTSDDTSLIKPVSILPALTGMPSDVYPYRPTFPSPPAGDEEIRNITGTLHPDITASDYYWLKNERAKAIAASMTDYELSQNVLSMAISSTAVIRGHTAALGFLIPKDQLHAQTAGEIILIKAKKDVTGASGSAGAAFAHVYSPSNLSDGTFLIATADMSRTLQASDALTEASYALVLCIKDGSAIFDLSGGEDGKIADPAIMAFGKLKTSGPAYPQVTSLSAQMLMEILKDVLAYMPHDNQITEASPFKTAQLPDIVKSKLGCLDAKGYVNKTEDGTFRIPPSTMSLLASTSVPPLEINAQELVSMPIFEALVSPDMTAVMGFQILGKDFKATSAGTINLLKAQSDGNVKRYIFAQNASSLTDGHYMLTDAGGKIFTANDALISDKLYILVMSIKDNGTYDLDPDAGHILDPASMTSSAQVKNIGDNREGGAGGGMGGCNAQGINILLAGLILCLAGKKLKK